MTEVLKSLKQLVHEIIFERLKIFDYNRTATAKSLGICTRGLTEHLYKLRLNGFDVPSKKPLEAKSISVTCGFKECAKVFSIKLYYYNNRISSGQHKFYCSKSCVAKNSNSGEALKYKINSITGKLERVKK